MNETVDRRILGAFVCLDAITGSVIADPLTIASPGWVINQNRRGVYVIFDGPGFDALTTQFEPAPNSWPAAVAFEITIQDPNAGYLPRRATITAPAAQPVLQSVVMYRTPAGATALNWSVIRASVTNSTSAAGLPWAVLRVTDDAGNAVLATGMGDARGEALLAVPALKLQVSQSGGTFSITTLAATVTAFFDPTILTAPANYVPDPDDILSNLSNTALKSATQAAQLGVGADQPLSFPIAV